jgi:ribonuclease HII
VCGVDEVGRGPLAGPVVAAAVMFPGPVPRRLASLIDDSKRLSLADRLRADAALRAHPGIAFAIAAAGTGEILRLNILHASMLAMRRAVLRLSRPPELALIDGNRAPTLLPCPAECVVRGDALCLSIAAASIMAKVVRDRLMARLARRHPQYGWAENAGYGTPAHLAALRAHGPTPHHRAGFGTVRALLAEGAIQDTQSGH